MSLLETIEEVKVQTNTSFSTVLPGLQLAWDSTSYGALDKCARYYQHSIVEGRGFAYGTENPHLKWGLIFHSATELYDRERALGKDHDAALVSAMRHAIIETWDFALKRPWVSDEPTKTRNTLLRSIVWYCDKFQDDPLKTVILDNGKPAVELSFRFDPEIETGTGESILICGHIDRAVEFNSENAITDKKTTKAELNDNFFKQFNPDSQISIYSIAGIVVMGIEVNYFIIDGIQVQVNGTRFRRQIISISSDQLEEWLHDFKIKIRQAEDYARENYWPMNRKACGFGQNQCTFRPVCSSDPSIRQTLLDAMFIRRTWDPLVPR
jgi:hypothetical protein